MIGAAALPRPVRPGDRVGVAALSSRVDPRRLEQGVAALRALGFEPVLANNLDRVDGLFAGSDRERLEAFHELAADESLRAIFFARGGHGLLRVLPQVDWALLARFPRAYVGYSDLTPFLLGVVERLRLVSFHGPMVAADLARGLSADEIESLRLALAGQPQVWPIERWWRGGVAEGPLLGGCLSLLSDTVGTPFLPSLEGCVVFLEDTHEALYRADRMLLHLHLSSNLRGVAALVFGQLDLQGNGTDGDVEQCLDWLRTRTRGPLGWGLPAGHRQPNWTLPLGAWVRLDSGNGEMRQA
jgi:muramoyltetrapeptide carboxypeptidase